MTPDYNSIMSSTKNYRNLWAQHGEVELVSLGMYTEWKKIDYLINLYILQQKKTNKGLIDQ